MALKQYWKLLSHVMIHGKMFEKNSPKKLFLCAQTKSNNKILLNLELDIDSSTTLTIDTIDTSESTY